MANVEAVTFRNAEGQRLLGTLHVPELPMQGLPAVVLLSPGVKMRVGPGRLYVPLTEMLVSAGYTVLRFDFFGLGDSEGELQEQLLVDVYNHIEVGRYVGDTLSALNWLRKERGFERFMLGGLCGGAITAILAAERDAGVESLLSLGMTVTLASKAATPARYLTAVQLDSAKRHYLRKVFNIRAWRSFFTFRSNYAVIFRMLARQLMKVGGSLSGNSAAVSAAPMQQDANANPLFPSAFLAFLRRGGRALMLFSGKDRLQGEYEEKFAIPYAEHFRPYREQVHQHTIPDANHVLSLPEWQQEMIDVSRQWLYQMHSDSLGNGAEPMGRSRP